MAEGSTVLVVDDSAFMRSRVKRLLKGRGMKIVGEARDGDEGARMYSDLHPDLVTMDLTMRGADGLAGTRAILKADPDAVVVLFSIVDDPQMLEEAMRSGIKAYVHKSRPEELADRLEELLRKEC